MKKTIYCVYWRWLDADGNEILPRRAVTHTWYTSYRKANKAFEKQKEILYSNYTERRIENDSPNLKRSTDDASYELSAVKIHAQKDDKSCIRLVLAAADIE